MYIYNMNIYIYINMYTYIYIYLCAHIYMYIYVCVYIHIYVYLWRFLTHRWRNWDAVSIGNEALQLQRLVDSMEALISGQPSYKLEPTSSCHARNKYFYVYTGLLKEANWDVDCIS